jgi:PAS domain S-box-containing protein
MSENLRLLVVDDDRRMTKTLSDILRVKGYRAETVHSGAEALEKIQAAAREAEGQFDCVLTDIKMPEMSGIEMHRAVKALDPELPVVFMTAYATGETVREGLEDGAIASLAKPLNIEELLGKLAGVLGLRPQSVRQESRHERMSDMDSTNRGILVVDDDPNLTKTLSDILKMNGYVPFMAPDGKTAIEQIRHEAPEIALIDLKLPDMSGLDVLHEIKAHSPATECIVLTGYASQDSAIEAVNLGAYQYMQKPYDMEQLLSAIRRAFDKRVALAKYKCILQTAMDGFWVVDSDGGIVEVNDSYCKMTGYGRKEILSMSIFDVDAMSKSQDTAEYMKSIAALGYGRFETQHMCKDGRTIYIDVCMQPLAAEPGLFVAFLRDITERKQAEKEQKALRAQLMQSQRLDSMGTLAGCVAHEINNPINGIMNYAQLIQDRLGEKSSVQEFASEIIVETERVTSIVRNLLTFSRQEQQEHNPARIADIVEAVVSLIRTIIRRDQITFTTDIPEDLPKIKCNSQQIQQILMNLITNARDALNERYPTSDEDKVLIITAQTIHKGDNLWIRTTVEDHGIGIAKDVMDKMFDPYFTTKPKNEGAGLGLSISHGIARDHKGALVLESEPGQYTRVHLDLPAGNLKGEG